MLKLVSFYNLLVECQVGGLPPNLCIKNAVWAEDGDNNGVAVKASQVLSDVEVFWLEKAYPELIFDSWWKHGGKLAAIKRGIDKETFKDSHDKSTA